MTNHFRTGLQKKIRVQQQPNNSTFASMNIRNKNVKQSQHMYYGRQHQKLQLLTSAKCDKIFINSTILKNSKFNTTIQILCLTLTIASCLTFQASRFYQISLESRNNNYLHVLKFRYQYLFHINLQCVLGMYKLENKFLYETQNLCLELRQKIDTHSYITKTINRIISRSFIRLYIKL